MVITIEKWDLSSSYENMSKGSNFRIIVYKISTVEPAGKEKLEMKWKEKKANEKRMIDELLNTKADR